MFCNVWCILIIQSIKIGNNSFETCDIVFEYSSDQALCKTMAWEKYWKIIKGVIQEFWIVGKYLSIEKENIQIFLSIFQNLFKWKTIFVSIIFDSFVQPVVTKVEIQLNL